MTLKKFKERLERLEDTTLTVNRVYPAKQERDFSLDGGQIAGCRCLNRDTNWIPTLLFDLERNAQNGDNNDNP